MQSTILSVREVAAYLSIHTDMVYVLVKLNKLPHLLIHNSIIFTKESLDVWAENEI
ncbi:helix-turn-helix domain-containing protein [Oceanobacillus manasiensis]|uniref:helix-turn-helix domain-containing protein n=1 Tax=Oceanobacillus manasiensis TaxID=586413 RepID=UPI000AD56D67|nr:helix-turn-helix domain-containing protein [Oceanobacillus manasiensis]